MMSLRDYETRHLVTLGLRHMKNPLIEAIINKNNRLDMLELTPIDIAFYVAPLINAVTRVGAQEEKRIIFEAMLDWKGYDEVPSTKRGHKPGDIEILCEQAARICANIKNRQTKLQDTSVEQIENLISRDNLTSHKILLIKLDEFSMDKGLTGVVANKLLAKYQQPVAILNKIIEPDGSISWMGSARGSDKFDMNDLRQFCIDSDLITLAAGHPNAFGIGLTDENVDKFIQYADDKLKDVTFDPSYKVDFIWPANDFKYNDVLDIGRLENYWGQDVEEAKVAIESVNITKDNITLMSREKNPTIKISLPNGVDCLKFRSSEEEYNALSSAGCTTINLIGKCSINRYNGREKPQVFIEDYDIIKQQEYYF